MRCLKPILVRDKRGEVRKASCKQCIACRVNRAQEWTIRLMDEERMSDYSLFITLTYDEEHLPRVSDKYATLVKSDTQGFWKLLRKNLKDVKIRYYLCGEYGDKYGRPHYHAIVFFNGFLLRDNERKRLETIIEKCWRFGHVYFGDVNAYSCGYVCRYCTKLLTGPRSVVYKERNIIPEFSLQSRRPGIAGYHVEKFAEEYRRLKYKRFKGKKVPLPRFYKDRSYDENAKIFERAALAVKEAMSLEKYRADVAAYGADFVENQIEAREIQDEVNLIARLGLKKKRKA